MKSIDWEQPHIQQVFGQAIWNHEKGMWEVTLTLTDMAHSNFDKYVTIQSNFEVDVEVCDELVFPVAIMQANGLRFDEAIEGAVTKNPKRDGKEVDF